MAKTMMGVGDLAQTLVDSAREDMPLSSAKVRIMARLTEALCDRAQSRCERISGHYAIIRGKERV